MSAKHTNCFAYTPHRPQHICILQLRARIEPRSPILCRCSRVIIFLKGILHHYFTTQLAKHQNFIMFIMIERVRW